jgi:hypothetical protein
LEILGASPTREGPTAMGMACLISWVGSNRAAHSLCLIARGRTSFVSLLSGNEETGNCEAGIN